jgi:hypothetical protein
MKPRNLNRRATAVFFKVLQYLKETDHVKIDNSNNTFMPLIAERLHKGVVMNLQGTIYSFAHYYKQNGDSVPDPDMMFFVCDQSQKVYPLTFQDSLTYNEAIFLRHGSWFVSRVQHHITTFANMWLNNIYYQQLNKPLPQFKSPAAKHP